MHSPFPYPLFTPFGMIAMVVAAAPAPAEIRTVVLHVAPGMRSPDRAAQRIAIRLDRAALEVCGASDFSLREVKQGTRESDCYREAQQGALRQIGDARLAAAIGR